ncbi:unnamed protein product [Rotaria sp. Silwood2]|nr:unnamed protein product [Rotaria sp. Silwood2]CAF4654318.1 unnamed protein product [Rotaria sp. Silwood2]
MSENPRYRPYITNTKYSPIGSSNKLNLLLQRSLRYSYRQRCCECCPTILCELLFPLIIIGLLALIRYGTNALIREMNENPGSIPINFDHRLCSQDKNTTTTLSKDLFKRCFKFPPSYQRNDWTSFSLVPVSNRTNIIFQPMTNETKELVILAEKHLIAMNCSNTNIWCVKHHLSIIRKRKFCFLFKGVKI